MHPRMLALLACAALQWQALAAPPPQIPLQAGKAIPRPTQQPDDENPKRPLHGRYLQISDFHPDRFYEVYSSTAKEHACHRGQGPAGVYGAETSECDSPVALINKTMDWISKELKDEIDFVIWTGDSARHDNDEHHPRNDDEVVSLNKMMVQKVFEVFGKRNGDEEDDDPNNDYIIPIVPNLGNNDILPHNIMRHGPNKWTRTYAQLWKQFIPEEQKHQFEQGGWFNVEVIPNKLAVFSLNTLYFFASNAAADGCANPTEPGFDQMEWLRVQLQFMRDRGMKAILIGHVPPAREKAKTSWDETCWQKYTLWLRQYRDVIVSSHYGHFNYDHFILQDFEDLRKGTKRGKMPDYIFERASGDDDFRTVVSSDYFLNLRDSWSRIACPPSSLGWFESIKMEMAESCPSRNFLCQLRGFLPSILNISKGNKREKYLKEIGGEYAERYAVSFVTASVVPNLFPVIRVFEYNITGLTENTVQHGTLTPNSLPKLSPDPTRQEKTIMKKKKYRFDIPEPPPKTAPPGPAYSPQTFSLLSFRQYLANLTRINNDFLSISENDKEPTDSMDDLKWNEGKHKGKKPHDKDHTPNPKKFKFELHYDTREDNVYKLKDLTMPTVVDLARRIGNFVPEKGIEKWCDSADLECLRQSRARVQKKGHKERRRKQNEAWYAFIRRAYVETLDPEEIKDEFG